jgi:hypothetical protein
MMGLSFFLRIVYYFGFMSLRDVGIIELLTSMLAGIFLCGGMVVYVSCLHRNAPGLYGMVGAAECLMLIVLSFNTGSALRIILAILWYVLAAVILLITVGGYLPGKLLAALMFFVPATIRFLFFDIGRIGIIAWVNELAVLSVLIGIGCLAMGLKKTPRKK